MSGEANVLNELTRQVRERWIDKRVYGTEEIFVKENKQEVPKTNYLPGVVVGVSVTMPNNLPRVTLRIKLDRGDTVTESADTVMIQSGRVKNAGRR